MVSIVALAGVFVVPVEEINRPPGDKVDAITSHINDAYIHTDNKLFKFIHVVTVVSKKSTEDIGWDASSADVGDYT